jgi:hypothetical protein
MLWHSMTLAVLFFMVCALWMLGLGWVHGVWMQALVSINHMHIAHTHTHTHTSAAYMASIALVPGHGCQHVYSFSMNGNTHTYICI